MTAEPGDFKTLSDAMALHDIVEGLWDHMHNDTPLEDITTADVSALVDAAARSVEGTGMQAGDMDTVHGLVALWMHGFLAGEKWGTRGDAS